MSHHNSHTATQVKGGLPPERRDVTVARDDPANIPRERLVLPNEKGQHQPGCDTEKMPDATIHSQWYLSS
jgi:hypothetical protein